MNSDVIYVWQLVVMRAEGMCATWTAAHCQWKSKPTTQGQRRRSGKPEADLSRGTPTSCRYDAPAQQPEIFWPPCAACSSACNKSWSLTLRARYSHWHPTAVLPNRGTGKPAMCCGHCCMQIYCRAIAPRPALQVTDIVRSYVSYMITCFVS